MQRSYKINYNYGLNPHSEVVGGLKAGRFRSTATSVARKKKCNKKKFSIGFFFKRLWLLIKIVFVLTGLAWLCSTIEVSDRPFNQVEASEPVVENTFPKVFMSADKPADLFALYFGKDAEIMRAICKAESNLNPKAVSKLNRNKTRDYGLCQVNSIHADHVGGDLTKLLDEETNLRVSAEILKDQGFTAWTVYKSGSYKKFLK